MTHMKTTVWVDRGAVVTAHDGANVSIWVGDDLTLFGTAETLGAIGERIVEEALRIIEERLDAAALHREAMAEEAMRDVAD